MPLLLFFLLLTTTAAYAAPEVSLVAYASGNKASKIILSPTQDGYKTNEPVDSSEKIRLKFDKRPLSIEVRAAYTAAIGDDGPWQNIQPESMVYTKWVPIQVDEDVTIPLDTREKYPAVVLPKEFKCQPSDTSGCDDSKRWTDLYRQCKRHPNDTSNANPCYIYQSGLDVRVKYKGENEAKSIHFSFPGGC